MIIDKGYHPSSYTNYKLFEDYNKLVSSHLKESIIVLTFDTEVFGRPTPEHVKVYPEVLKGIAEILRYHEASASFCVQLLDSPSGNSKRTPPAGVQNIIDVLGKEAIELHCLHHDIYKPTDYYHKWFKTAIEALYTEYGCNISYFAQPSWVYDDTTASLLQHVPEIEAARGIQSGPSFWKPIQYWDKWSLTVPYLYRDKLYFPYMYVDWKHYDFFGNILSFDPVEWHCVAISYIKKLAQHVFMESIGHPFRIAAGNYGVNLAVFSKTIEQYKAAGFKVVSARQALDIIAPITRLPDIHHLMAPNCNLSSHIQEFGVPNLELLNGQITKLAANLCTY